MPELGEDLPATILDGGGRTVLVLVDHVLVEGLAVELVGVFVHEGAHERGEVEPGVAIEHRFVVDQLIGGVWQHPFVTEAVEVARSRLARPSEQWREFALVSDVRHQNASR